MTGGHNMISNKNTKAIKELINKVWKDNTLPFSVRKFFETLISLTERKGYCYALNGYLAKIFGVVKDTISKWVSKLVKRGYITTELIYKGKEVIGRKIFINKTLLPTITKKQKKNINLDKINQEASYLNNSKKSITKNRYPTSSKVQEKSIKESNTLKESTTIEQPKQIVDFSLKNISTEKPLTHKTLRADINKTVGGKIYDGGFYKILKVGEQMIRKYLHKWDKFNTDKINNKMGFFIDAVYNGFDIPNKHSIDNKPIQRNKLNFDQRQYSDEFYESLYDIGGKDIVDSGEITIEYFEVKNGFTQRKYSDEFYESLYEV
jgi:hypothetical protein